MSYPFLAFHLQSLSFDALNIGIILGCHYFFAGVAGIFGGAAADRWNPKYGLVFALLIGALSFFGLSQSKSFLSFLLWNCLLAISSSTFEPIASVLITSHLAREFRAFAFRLRYLAINIGAAIGPLVGALFFVKGPRFSFCVTSILLAIYAGLFLFLRAKKREGLNAESAPRNMREILICMAKHKSFLLLIAANLFVTMTYGQIFSTLPQILSAKMENSRQLYSILLTVNPLTVIAVSVFLSQFLSLQNPRRLFSGGALLLAISFLGFHLSVMNEMSYIFFMVLFTLAEITLIPTTAKVLFDLAPEKHRGAYLGSESTSYLGFFIGNIVGGWLLQTGQSVFLFCIFCSFAAFFLYRLSLSSQEREVKI